MKSSTWLLQFALSLFSFSLFVACSAKKKFDQTNQADRGQITALPFVSEKLPETHFAEGVDFAIATQGFGSTEAAKQVFLKGGNLIDAFVAASFAISVERPQSTGLGGGGFLIFYHKKEAKTYAFDFRESAPKLAFAEMYLQADGKLNESLSKEGVLSVGVPGLVAGLFEIHKEFGRLPWAELLDFSIQLAERGIEVYPHLEKAIQQQSKVLLKDSGARKIFFDSNKMPLRVGDKLIQKDLVRSLREIQKHGRKGFYNSWISTSLLDLMASSGGLIQKTDLDDYQVKRRNPVSGTYKDFRIVSMPPPSSGGIMLIQNLNLLENADLKRGSGDPKNLALTASSLQQAFADRAEYLGDADFGFIPQSELTDKNYGLQNFRRLRERSRLKSDEVRAGLLREEPSETVHMSMMDSEGNAISSTQTINGWFGSGVVIPKTGILLNNEMDDFSAKTGTANLYGAIGGEPNRVESNKRPLSSMSPSLVFLKNEEKPILSLGSPSGTRIVSCVLLSLLNILEYGMSLDEAQLSLRYHHQWMPDKIFVEEPGFPSEIHASLSALGFEIETKDLGCRIQAVQRIGSELIAISDPRGEGSAFAQ